MTNSYNDRLKQKHYINLLILIQTRAPTTATGHDQGDRDRRDLAEMQTVIVSSS